MAQASRKTFLQAMVLRQPPELRERMQRHQKHVQGQQSNGKSLVKPGRPLGVVDHEPHMLMFR